MNTKHTPGPWELSGDIVIGCPRQPPNPKADPIRDTICKIGWDFDGDRNATGELPWRVAEANARLIAAAPELLDLCRRFVEVENRIDDNYYMELDKLTREASQVIARATQ